MGHFVAPWTSFKAAALLLLLGGALAAGGCEQTEAEPKAEPVDQHQPTPPRRGSY